MTEDELIVGGRTHRVSRLNDGGIRVDGHALEVVVLDEATVKVTDGEAGSWLVSIARGTGGERWVFVNGETFVVATLRPTTARAAEQDDGALSPPMPTTVRQVEVKVGDVVQKGDVLMVLEAMKMEFAIRASRDGRVAAVHGREGETVGPGTRVVALEAAGHDET